MAIPAFRSDGTLPPGEHIALWTEVIAHFGSTQRRQRLLDGPAQALSAFQAAGCSTIWLDGSFVTDKPEPNDYDLCWDEGNVEITRLDPVFLDFSNGRRAQKSKYLGEAFPAMAPADVHGTPFRAFFQQSFGVPKGIIRIDL